MPTERLPMFPFTKDAFVWLPKDSSSGGHWNAEDISRIQPDSPLADAEWWWNLASQDMYNPPPGYYYSTWEVVNGHYIGNPRENENYQHALQEQLRRQEEEQTPRRGATEHAEQEAPPQQQGTPYPDHGAAPGRARHIDVRSDARIWRKRGDTMAHRVYSAWEIANTQHTTTNRGDRWTMNGDDSNSAFSSKEIGDMVFNDTEPWDLFHAIDDWPGLLRVQSERDAQLRDEEQSRRDEALTTARDRAQRSGHSSPCTEYQGWGSLTARTIDRNANIWRKAEEPDVRSVSAADIARAYLANPSVGYELWHIGTDVHSRSRCHSARMIAEAVFSNTDGEPLEQYLRRPHTPPPDEEQSRRDRMLAEAGPAGVAVTAGPAAAETPARTQPRSVTSQGSTLTHVAAVMKSTDQMWQRKGRGSKEFSAQQIVKSRAPPSTKEWFLIDSPASSRLYYSPAEIGNGVYIDTGGMKLRNFISMTDRYGAFATGGGTGTSYSDSDDDDDDPSPNNLRFDFASTTPWWYRTWRGAAAYVGRNAKSAQDIFNGLNANGSVWVKRAEDDEGEHKDPPGQQYSVTELGNAIFADTGGQTLSNFLQRGQAGAHTRTRPKRKPKTYRRRKNNGRRTKRGSWVSTRSKKGVAGGGDDDDGDADDSSPNCLKLPHSSTDKHWDIDLGGGVLVELGNSARDILDLPGVQLYNQEWHAVLRDDDGEKHEGVERRRYSPEELRNAIFTDTDGQTLFKFLQRGPRGGRRPRHTRRNRRKRQQPRSRKTRGLRRKKQTRKSRRQTLRQRR